MPKQPREIAAELVSELDALSAEIECGDWTDPDSDPRVIRAGQLSAELAACDADEETLAPVREAYARVYETAAQVRDNITGSMRQTFAFREHAKAFASAYGVRSSRASSRGE